MSKLIAWEMLSLDGFISGPNGELDWHAVDAEFNDCASDLLDHADTLLFGRVTYDLMAGFWPTESALSDDPVIAKKMNSIKKVVFSRTMQSADWSNSRVVSDVESEVRRLKGQAGGDLVIMGSGTILSLLGQVGLVDEYRLLINPTVLGEGKPLFQDMKHRLKMRLVKTKPFKSGLVGLFYEPAD